METVAICYEGSYVAPSGRKIDIKQDVQAAVERSDLFTPSDTRSLISRAQQRARVLSFKTQFKVENGTTLQCARRLAESSSVAVLNFASARNPGGGFLNGSQAQEESLARASSLYPCLQRHMRYYDVHRGERSSLYTDHLIVSPDVVVFRDDNGDLLEEPWRMTVLTSPAPNAGALEKNDPKSVSSLEPTFRRRMEQVLAAAVVHEQPSIVLGAWGCGVFRNDPVMVARLFAEFLEPGSPFSNEFEHVTFAVLDREGDIIWPYFDWFGPGNSSGEQHETDLPATSVDRVPDGVRQAATFASEQTALDRYVAAPDPSYEYHEVSSQHGVLCDQHILQMTSQAWKSDKIVDKPVWKHWLILHVPKGLQQHTALLIIGGGSNERPAPTSGDKGLDLSAVATHSVIAELSDVPSEPLTFVGETRKRTEDAIIAYTWDQYLKTGDETWPLRLPMTKSAVRAMDTVTAFMHTDAGGMFAVNQFIVAGGSKRGWTTWATAAVDKRVVAIVPIVIDTLHMDAQAGRQVAAYGEYSSALKDYTDVDLAKWNGTSEFKKLMQIEDPYTYRDRFTMPKLLINSTGDQYFMPDSSQFYFDDLPGVKYLRYVPNTDHSLAKSDARKPCSRSMEHFWNTRHCRSLPGSSKVRMRYVCTPKISQPPRSSGRRRTPKRAISGLRCWAQNGRAPI